MPPPRNRELADDARRAGAGVRIVGVRREFPGGVLALDGLDLDVAPGEFVALLGPSGCGKSTLLRLVAALDRPDAGAVEVSDGQVAFVFQDAHLLPWRTVLENVMLPLELAGATPASARGPQALSAIEAVGLTDAKGRRPAELSGGMRMRVSLARALVTRPRLLLLDEPFAALDELTRHRLDDQLRALWLAQGMTVLFVTHAIIEAAYLAERAVVFSPRPARVVADLRVDLPRERSAALRTDPAFVRVTRVLFEALERGGDPRLAAGLLPDTGRRGTPP
ncbi:MAG: ABC transporter ATP-binding protein [Myxococcales bacterium]|nr:ABC transporter ATP-binding protein [Myxococcales bacterium]